jgi:hypothetical protein
VNEPEEASQLLDQQADKNCRALVDRVLRETKPFGPEWKEALAELRRVLLSKER